MIIVDCEQGTQEWLKARLGVPTGSEFNKIITPAKMQQSSQADGYVNKLIGEWLTGEPDDTYKSDLMDRGTELEGEARDYYSFKFDVEVKQVGFCLEDAKRYGCSPDGLVGEDGGIEIKCPSRGVHVGYLINERVPTDYKLQVIGSLLVTGRDWWDFISYYPGIESLVVRTNRADVEEELQLLEKALIATNKKIYDKQQLLIKRGLKEAA